MDDDRYNAIKKGIENKKEQTEKEYELNKLKIKEKEEESRDKFIFFSNKIFEVIFPNINLFEEYKKSEYFQNFHNSEPVIKLIKKSIINFTNSIFLFPPNKKIIYFEKNVWLFLPEFQLFNFHLFKFFTFYKKKKIF